jgi:hypothetical protein
MPSGTGVTVSEEVVVAVAVGSTVAGGDGSAFVVGAGSVVAGGASTVALGSSVGAGLVLVLTGEALATAASCGSVGARSTTAAA